MPRQDAGCAVDVPEEMQAPVVAEYCWQLCCPPDPPCETQAPVVAEYWTQPCWLLDAPYETQPPVVAEYWTQPCWPLDAPYETQAPVVAEYCVHPCPCAGRTLARRNAKPTSARAPKPKNRRKPNAVSYAGVAKISS